MKIVSINVGLPKTITWQGKEITTGIFKNPIPGPVMVRKLNIEGDKQADLTVHGGADKAVYAYSFKAYDQWKRTLNISDLAPGAFGENLTFDELDETKICVGDVLKVGETELQVVQPRQPCFKLGAKFGDMKVLNTFNQIDRPGIYFRVLKEGLIATGDEAKIISQEASRVPLIELFHFYKTKTIKPKTAKALLAVKSLNTSWRNKLLNI